MTKQIITILACSFIYIVSRITLFAFFQDFPANFSLFINLLDKSHRPELQVCQLNVVPRHSSLVCPLSRQRRVNFCPLPSVFCILSSVFYSGLLALTKALIFAGVSVFSTSVFVAQPRPAVVMPKLIKPRLPTL